MRRALKTAREGLLNPEGALAPQAASAGPSSTEGQATGPGAGGPPPPPAPPPPAPPPLPAPPPPASALDPLRGPIVQDPPSQLGAFRRVELVWSPATHAAFPPRARARACTLLRLRYELAARDRGLVVPTEVRLAPPRPCSGPVAPGAQPFALALALALCPAIYPWPQSKPWPHVHLGVARRLSWSNAPSWQRHSRPPHVPVLALGSCGYWHLGRPLLSGVSPRAFQGIPRQSCCHPNSSVLYLSRPVSCPSSSCAARCLTASARSSSASRHAGEVLLHTL